MRSGDVYICNSIPPCVPTIVSRTEKKTLFLVINVSAINNIHVIRQLIVMTVVRIYCNTITCQHSIKFQLTKEEENQE